jgi:hypothetical protein
VEAPDLHFARFDAQEFGGSDGDEFKTDDELDDDMSDMSEGEMEEMLEEAEAELKVSTCHHPHSTAHAVSAGGVAASLAKACFHTDERCCGWLQEENEEANRPYTSTRCVQPVAGANCLPLAKRSTWRRGDRLLMLTVAAREGSSAGNSGRTITRRARRRRARRVW